MCRKFGAALYRARQGERSRLFSARYLLIKLANFCQRQWSDRLYGVVRLLHQESKHSLN